MQMTVETAGVTAGGLSRYADLLMALAAFMALPLFSKGFFQQPAAYWLESLSLHMLIACTLAWWLRVLIARTLTAFAAAVLLIYGIGLVSKIKTGYLGSPLMPWDVLLAPQMLRLRETYPEVIWLATVVPVLLCLMLIALKRERPSPGRPWRRALLGGVLVATVISGSYAAVSPNGIRNMPWDQRENYRQHGFLLGLLLNAKGLWMAPPAVTTAEAARRLLPYAPGMAEPALPARPDVIVILSESYSSLPEVFGLEGAQCFDAFRAAGRMTTMVFGGYTANVEFELLTGYPMAFFPSGSVPWEMYLNAAQPEALPNQFRRHGYETVALHPFAGSFWNRDHVFPLLGFQSFVDETAMRNPARTGTFIDDSALYGEIRQVLETAASSRPVFAFGITMQAHGDYAAAGRYPSAVTLPPGIAARLGPEERRSLATYAAIIQHHERATCEFIDWIKSRQRETVLLYFGDHLPALGHGLRPYQRLGIVSEDVAAERYRDHRRLYTTPMFIWSNRKGFQARTPDPVPAFALGGSLMEAASLPVPAHFRYSLAQAPAYRDLACCYVNREGERISLDDTSLAVLYRHAWDHLLRR